MTIKLQGNEILIEFQYDPGLITKVRMIPDRKWQPAPRKVWTVPATPFHARKTLEVFGNDLDVWENVRFLAKKDGRSWLDSDLDLSVGEFAPFPYQVGAVEFIKSIGGRGLICDEVGIGKTIEAITYARYVDLRRILVVCPASILYKWEREFHRWYPELSGSTQVVPDNKTEITGSVNIISYDMMSRRVVDLTKRSYELAIFDECFPYDTRILTNVGWLQIGDLVENRLDVRVASCNLSVGDIQYKKVTRHIKTPRHTPLLRIRHEYGSFICTTNHQIYTDRGLIRADQLVCGESLRMVRSDLPISICGKSGGETTLLRNVMCRKVASESSGKEAATKISRTKNFRLFDWETTTTFQQQNEEIDGRSLVQSQDGGWSEEVARGEPRQDISGPWRKWSWTDCFTEALTGSSSGICAGVRDRTEVSEGDQEGCPYLLQGGYCPANRYACCRIGWQFSQQSQIEIHGSEEDGCIDVSRVESIEVLEPSCYHEPTGSGGSYPYVYCLEVEDNHNFFADGILVSNCTRLKNHKTQRCIAAKIIAPGVKHILGLSGTPIVNRPKELFNMLNILDDRAWQWRPFFTRYCGWTGRGSNTDGAFHLDELEERLRSFMIRRFKRDVMSQLPPLRRTVVPLELGADWIRTYRLLVSEDPSTIAKLFPNSKGYFANRLDWLNAIRQFLEKARASSVAEWADDFLESAEGKLVIYCGFKSTIRFLSDYLHKYGVTEITGDVSNKDRQNIIDRWQTAHTERVMLLTSAGGEGIDLFGRNGIDCSTILFAGREWSPATEDQIEGRLDRTGQLYPVEAVYLVAQETIDEDIHRLIEYKREVIKSAVGLAPVVSIEGDLLGLLASRGIIKKGVKK